MNVDVRLIGKIVRIYMSAVSVKASLNHDLKVASLNEDDAVVFANLDPDYWDEVVIKKE